MNLWQWNQRLWADIQSKYVAGQPIYLAFDKLLLGQLYGGNSVANHGGDQAVLAAEDLHHACRTLFIVDYRKVALQPELFKKTDNGVSLVLVFAVQQIIAVEEMAADTDCSADAYYRHYCQAIDKGISNRKKCPIGYDDFERIWDTLKHELLIQLQADERQITFKQGKGSKNKYRNYPLSQALLTLDDLNTLATQLTPADLNDQQHLLNSVRQLAPQLSARGHRKVYNQALSQALCEQIIGHQVMPHLFELPGSKDAPAAAIECRDGDFFIGVETQGWDDWYIVRYQINTEVADASGFKRMFNDYFATHRVMALTPEHWGGFSLQTDWAADISTKDLLLLYPSGFDGSLLAELNRKFDGFKSHMINHTNVPRGFVLRNCSGFPQPGCLADILPGESNLGEKRVLPKMAFAGGLAVDQRANKFLLGYPPTQILVDESQLSDADVVCVNAVTQRVADFIEKLAACRVEQVLLLEYQGSSAKLNLVGTRVENNCLLIGYSVAEGYLAAAAGVLNDCAERYYAGYAWQNTDLVVYKIERALDEGKLMQLMKTHVSTWVAATVAEQKMVLNWLRTRLQTYHLKDHFMRKISVSRKLPTAIVAVIRRESADR